MESKSYLVTTALYYANGPLHLGHMVEMIEADLWVRTKKQQGHSCYFISGNDVHGTPIMLKADELKVTPSELVQNICKQHRATIHDYMIDFDFFSRTDTKNNHSLVLRVYECLKKNDLLIEQENLQAFDTVKEMFLPDRFVKGACPQCKAPDQYGDNCDQCGATYNPTDLIGAYSVLSGTAPDYRPCSHLYLDLKKLQNWFVNFLPDKIDGAVFSKLQEWLQSDLKPWAITREKPYHGFTVPDRQGQYFYVWFDAPIGYLGIFSEYLESIRTPRQEIEKKIGCHSDLEMIHFIGKDIAYFHAFFWTALVKASDLLLPSKFFVHGFLNINGLKMSKSKGTLIEAQHFARTINPELFRYFIASKMNGSIDDLNFDLKEFVQKINSDLVGKYINILSRCARLLEKYTSLKMVTYPRLPNGLYNRCVSGSSSILEHCAQRKFSKAIAIFVECCELINTYLTEQQPWQLIVNPDSFQKGWEILSEVLNSFEILTQAMKPVMPSLTEKVLSYFGDGELLRSYEPLLSRLDESSLQEKFMSLQNTQQNTVVVSEKDEESYISITDFSKVQLKVATIKEAYQVEGADKLLRLILDIGNKTIQVFAGIKNYFAPESLIGLQVIACVNLQPRQMKFGLSEGMVLAASDSTGLSLLTVSSPREAGSKVS